MQGQPPTVYASLGGHQMLRGALAPDVVAGLRAAMAALARDVAPSREILYTHRPPPDGRPGMAALMDQWLNPHRRDDEGSTLTAAETLRATVAALCGGPVVLVQDVLMDKRPRHGVFPWHQDFPFWPVDRPAGVVVWAALDAIDGDGGGLRLALDGTEAVGPPIDLHTGAPQAGFEHVEVPALAGWVAPELAPGDAIAFSPLTWHGSGRPARDVPRRVWASTWLAADVRWCRAAAPRHPILRRVVDGERVGARGWKPLCEEPACAG